MENLGNVLKMEIEKCQQVGIYATCEISKDNTQLVLDFMNENFAPYEIKVNNLKELKDLDYAIGYYNEPKSLGMQIYFDSYFDKIIVALFYENHEKNYNGDQYEYHTKGYTQIAIDKLNTMINDIK